MLEIRNVKKIYKIGEIEFPALKGINLAFREHEFVAILGQSGSGKTTLLNIIGGLDRYDSGDIIIDNVSTKKYKDKDWDAYRNHRVGFVFQNYNLIPHLDVLSNVELALTLSGVSREERIEKAKKVLERVGLKDHMYKRPNQLSGGQQQRVSIARALVNDPTIILADEPTGALDSETSVDIMNLLTEISKDKLIIMVTHNETLAKEYANRIVSIKDGELLSDTNPFNPKEKDVKEETQKTSMSFFTALRLSFKNLLTKKVRTLITALAGSIGIIGVALVMSLQYGFTQYLDNMERGTFAGLPIQINRSFLDINALMEATQPGAINQEPIEGGIGGYEPLEVTLIKENKLSQEYIEYLKNSQLEENNYATIVYNYGIKPNTMYVNNGKLIRDNKSSSRIVRQSTFTLGFLEEFFDVVSGRYYTENEYEAILFVDNQNRVPNDILRFLGLLGEDETESGVIPYSDIVGKEIKILSNDVFYANPDENNTKFRVKSDEELIEIYNSNNNPNVITIKIVGIVRSNTQLISTSQHIAFNNKVRDRIMELNKDSQVVIAQRNSDDQFQSVIEGVSFSLVNPLTKYTKEDLLDELGGIETPSSILIYPNGFDGKEQVIKVLDKYNELNPDEQIGYTDTVASAVSVIKDVMNAISAVLIAFSSISLVVSSVMIGIITYTSVLERTREIGILRSIGARKKDISRVFNAEAILIGFIAGILGVTITYSLVPIINIFLDAATGTSNTAQLFYGHAILLIAISVVLTFVAGLIPSRIAASKDPVIALRSE
ncbi:ATP-binding cassette domain-containing protein [Acholeplasma equifetale]|uniref:ABC transporter ATP-binding protein/permease n=1 Tax=Acholeplasma equifetale TaxID=264634 RepID=UPI00047BC61A|nr:ATP-binding cassette domain-containing protein [Acholeplasma equifetale]